MFDKEGIKNYVGPASGNSYMSGLSGIETVFETNIDREFDKDRCRRLLRRLEEYKNERGIEPAQKHQRQNWQSHLKKYVEYRNKKAAEDLTPAMYLRDAFVKWMALQKKPNGQPYAANTIQGYSNQLENGIAKLGVPSFAGIDCFTISNAADFTVLTHACMEKAKQADRRDGHADRQMGLDFYAAFLAQRGGSGAASDYWPPLSVYNPNISIDGWLSVLRDRSVTNLNNLAMLKMMLELGGESTCARLADVYGKTYNYYNKLGSSFGEKVKAKLNCPDCVYDGVTRYYPIPFVGRYMFERGNKRFAWKLRDELKEALLRMDLSDVPLKSEDIPSTDIGLNTILYGPPGTGKTYHTVFYAVAIIENKPLAAVEQEDYLAVLARYNRYKAAGQIAFTTFHQSYGYEEFIEGIKPVLGADDDEQPDIIYDVVPGVFKKFCEDASLPEVGQGSNFELNDYPTVWKVSLAGTGDNGTRSECLAKGHIRIGYDKYGSVITDETDFSKHGGKNVLNAFINNMKIGDIVLSCYKATVIDAVGVVTGDYEWHEEYGEFKRLRKVNWIVKGIQEDITRINNGISMTLSTVYKLRISVPDVMSIIDKYVPKEEGQPNTRKNYVFVIDEINRGNISKIFGELITLIEPDKRMGREQETTVVLPYSQKIFGVPDNVYLIGTMNTADRSIAQIDTALRRRFSFKEMQPDVGVLENVYVEDISIKEMLARMNERIAVLYDREHTIGHAYFMPLIDHPTIDTLAGIFADQIFPLLQEYFYDDYQKIILVLGDNRKEDKGQRFILSKPNDYSNLFGETDYEFEDANSYEINTAAFDNLDAYRFI